MMAHLKCRHPNCCCDDYCLAEDPFSELPNPRYPEDGKCEYCGRKPTDGSRLVECDNTWLCLVCEDYCEDYWNGAKAREA